MKHAVCVQFQQVREQLESQITRLQQENGILRDAVSSATNQMESKSVLHHSAKLSDVNIHNNLVHVQMYLFSTILSFVADILLNTIMCFCLKAPKYL